MRSPARDLARSGALPALEVGNALAGFVVIGFWPTIVVKSPTEASRAFDCPGPRRANVDHHLWTRAPA